MRKGAAFAVALALAFACCEFAAASKGHALFGDFRAFYCAGAAIAHAHDPYSAASLYTCERAQEPHGLYAAPAGVTVPAPLPGYTLAAFAVLALLPYTAAALVWLIVVIFSAAASIILCARLVDRSPAAIVPAFAIGFAAVVLPYGQLASIEIAALSALALALRGKRWNAAAIAAAVAAIVPHVALPALAAVFFFCRTMRPRLLLAAAALAAIDVASGGPHAALEYFAQVLPAHALSEIGRTSQYGLTWAAHALGAPDGLAILLGELSYVAMSCAGIFIARRLFATFGDAAVIALVPPAFAVFGGSFVHYNEIMAAIPAALLLFALAPQARKPWLLAACTLIALPWASCLNQPVSIVAFCVAAIWIVSGFGGFSMQVALRAGVACVAIVAAILIAAARLGSGVEAAQAAAHIAPGLAQASWSEYVRSHWAGTGAIWWIGKTPTWIGLLLLAVCGSYAVAKKDFVFGVAIEHAPIVS